MRPDPAVTLLAVRDPFAVGCHCAANRGSVLDNEVRSVNRWPEETGHPVPLRDRYPVPPVRAVTFVCQSWPHVAQCHHATRADPAVTCSGRAAPLRVGCHSAAMSG